MYDLTTADLVATTAPRTHRYQRKSAALADAAAWSRVTAVS